MKVRALLLSALLASGSAAAQSVLDCHLTPGWEQSGVIRQYDSGNLFEYKDGGAEGYFIFGFVRMSTVECKSGANTLTIDLSEMTDADAAYGLFAANLDPTSPISQIGMGGQVQAQSATFAKGNFYVEIVEVSSDANADDSSTLRSMASTLEVRLPGRVTPPAQLRWFPPGNVAPVRMVPESVLGLRELKRGYVAKYQAGQAFIVLEATPESASLVLKSLHLHFPGAVPALVGDEAWMSTRHISVVFASFARAACWPATSICPRRSKPQRWPRRSPAAFHKPCFGFNQAARKHEPQLQLFRLQFHDPRIYASSSIRAVRNDVVRPSATSRSSAATRLRTAGCASNCCRSA